MAVPKNSMSCFRCGVVQDASIAIATIAETEYRCLKRSEVFDTSNPQMALTRA